MNTETVEPDLEEAILGAILVSPTLLNSILKESKLRPSHFAIPKNRDLYVECLQLHEKGSPPDYELVLSNLRSPLVNKDYLQYLTTRAITITNAPHHAKRLVELAVWRQRAAQARRELAAIGDKNLDAYARARAYVDSESLEPTSFKTPEDLKVGFKDFLETATHSAIALPFEGLNKLLLGGFRRKQVTVLGGWSSHGKSVVMDQLLTFFASRGHSTHLYINEMGEEERVGRIITRETGISGYKVMNNRLDFNERQEVDQVLDRLPFPITPCAGWSIDEIVFDIRRQKFDVIGIDILHQFDYDSESDLARISRFINRTAKLSNCHIIATVHLNESRVKETRRPRPITRDIRGSGMIKNDADNVMMIYREQDPTTGDPINASSLYVCKARSGSLGGINCVFDPTFLSFVDREEIPTSYA